MRSKSAIEITPAPPDHPDATACLGRYFAEIALRFEGGFDPGQGGASADRDMAPPRGIFLIARLGGEPVGCGGLRFVDGVTGEIKRMWIAPEARGLGVGRQMVRALEDAAREAGLQTVRLDTNRALGEALALYRGEGYRDTEPFTNHPYAHLWLAKSLGADPPTG